MSVDRAALITELLADQLLTKFRVRVQELFLLPCERATLPKQRFRNRAFAHIVQAGGALDLR